MVNQYRVSIRKNSHDAFGKLRKVPAVISESHSSPFADGLYIEVCSLRNKRGEWLLTLLTSAIFWDRWIRFFSYLWSTVQHWWMGKWYFSGKGVFSPLLGEDQLICWSFGWWLICDGKRCTATMSFVLALGTDLFNEWSDVGRRSSPSIYRSTRSSIRSWIVQLILVRNNIDHHCTIVPRSQVSLDQFLASSSNVRQTRFEILWAFSSSTS